MSLIPHVTHVTDLTHDTRHMSICDATRINESCHVQMSHVTRINESCHIPALVKLGLVCVTHAIHVNA